MVVVRRGGALAGLASLLVLITAELALALPSESADATAGFDAKVRAVYESGGAIWVGGAFDNIVGTDAGPAVGIAALDPTTGGRKSGVTPPTLGGTNPIVYDFSEAGGVLYAAGNFTYSGGRNLVGLNPTTGAIVQTFSTASLRGVFATSGGVVLAGGNRLWAYNTSGSQISSFTPLVPTIDETLRGHGTPAQFRDIGVADDGYGIAVGQFDFINGSGQKVAVKFDVSTGAVQDWDVANVAQTSAAFGIELELAGPTLYVGTGGSDFAAAYRVSDGGQLWKTDTSGSAQAVTLWDPDTLIVGGHFQWVALTQNQQCGSNGSPNTACLNQPRLTAMRTSDGLVFDTWRPTVCCRYNGVWTAIVENGRLHIGGEFNKIGGVRHDYYARLPDAGSEPPPPPPGDGLFSDGFESGLTAWSSSGGMSTQTGTVHSGTFAATNNGSSAWAQAALSAVHDDLYARMWLNFGAQADTIQVMRLRNASNQNVVILIVTSAGKLRIRNAVAGTSTTLATTVHADWNDLQLRANVAGGSVELWLDNVQVASVSTNLGSNGVQRVEIGHRGSGLSYTAYYDDVEVDTAFIDTTF